MNREQIRNSWIVNTYIAHRGLHNETLPENSLAAFKNAISHNYAIELDVRLTSNGTVVVFHDTKTSRMTGADKYVHNLTSADLDELKLLDTDEKIPTLKEVLDLVNGQVPLLIEIKNDLKVGELESAVWNLLKEYKGEYAIQSFNPYVLVWFKENAPEVIRGQLSSYFKGEKLGFVKRLILRKMGLNKIAKPDFISYKAEDLPNHYCNKYSHLPILAWVVRSQKQYTTLFKDIDNIIFEDFTPKI